MKNQKLTAIATRLNQKRYYKYYFIAALLIAVLLFLVLPATQYKENIQKCSDSVAEVNKVPSQGPPSSEKYNKAYKNLGSSKKQCDGKPLGVQADKDKVTRFEYYYTKAATGYAVGKKEESKADATKALELYNSLPPEEKNLDKNKNKFERLNYIKEGTF